MGMAKMASHIKTGNMHWQYYHNIAQLIAAALYWQADRFRYNDDTLVAAYLTSLVPKRGLNPIFVQF